MCELLLLRIAGTDLLKLKSVTDFVYDLLIYMLTWKYHCCLKIHFDQMDGSEVCTKVSFTLPEVM